MHNINVAILSRFLFRDKTTHRLQSGKSVAYKIYAPNSTEFDSGTMDEITGTALYYKSWTPNLAGWWIFILSCGDPEMNDMFAYFVESGVEKSIYDLVADRDAYKADVSALALEATLTEMKGSGWSNETLKAIKDAVDAITSISASDVWNYGTRTLTDPDSYKADVSALALEATLTAMKGLGWSNETLKAIYDLISALNNVSGATDGATSSFVAVQDVSALVDTATSYGFKVVVNQSGANSVRYTTQYILIVTYKMS